MYSLNTHNIYFTYLFYMKVGIFFYKFLPIKYMYIMDSLSLDSEINKKIGWAGLTFARITKRVWESRKSAVKYGHFSVKSMHSQHIALWQWHLETLFWMRADLQCAFYLCSPKQILDIKLMDWVNSAVKSSAAHRCLNSFTPAPPASSDRKILKDLLHEQLAKSYLIFICKRDLRSMNLDIGGTHGWSLLLQVGTV